jgi:lysophospholipase L1-like esterase
MQHANIRWRALISCLGALLALAATSKTWGAAVTETAAEPRSVVILGASYAQAWGTPALPGFDQVINRGVGGDETGGMNKRFAADVVAARPDTVLIWGHVNNITRAAPDKVEAAKSAAKADYDEMLRQARAAGIRVILATEVPWTAESGIIATVYGWIASLQGKTSYATRTSAHVEEVNEYVRALARREGLKLLDFGRAFANEDGTRKQEYAAEDGSHISPAGYQALTEYATRELRARK